MDEDCSVSAAPGRQVIHIGGDGERGLSIKKQDMAQFILSFPCWVSRPDYSRSEFSFQR